MWKRADSRSGAANASRRSRIFTSVFIERLQYPNAAVKWTAPSLLQVDRGASEPSRGCRRPSESIASSGTRRTPSGRASRRWETYQARSRSPRALARRLMRASRLLVSSVFIWLAVIDVHHADLLTRGAWRGSNSPAADRRTIMPAHRRPSGARRTGAQGPSRRVARRAT